MAFCVASAAPVCINKFFTASIFSPFSLGWIENKKTYLYLKAIEFANAAEKAQLLQLFSIQPNENGEKIEAVKNLFNQTGAAAATQKAIQNYTFKAFETLCQISIDNEKKGILKSFGENLMGRKV